jgi:hypothetical protein
MSWNLMNGTIVNTLYKYATADQLSDIGLTDSTVRSLSNPNRVMEDSLYGAGKVVLGHGRATRHKVVTRAGKGTVAYSRMTMRDRRYGDQPSNELFERARANKHNRDESSLSKTAGLFLRPSDLSDHRGLASALEKSLTDPAKGKIFSKEASSTSLLHGAALGAVVGGTAETLRRQYTDPVPMPPPQQPSGIVGRIKHKLGKASAEADEMSRKHPISSTLAHAAIGAAVGAYMQPAGVSNLLTRHKKPVPRL